MRADDHPVGHLGGEAVRPGRSAGELGLALLAVVPGVALRLTGASPAPAVAAAVLFAAIVAAAFVLSWAAEAARVDIPGGVAVSVVALIAVLPEYAVDAVFALQGGDAVQAGEAAGTGGCPSATGGASPCSLALANMTGGNRLLLGVGWALVVLLAVRRRRRRGVEAGSGIVLERSSAVELTFLGLACAYALTLPFKRTVTLVDTAALVALFVAYTVRISRAPTEEPDLRGPAAWIGGLPAARRRASFLALLLLAAGVILLCAEPFAESLVGSGRAAGIDEFLLVQWLAPLASEAPELLVAGLAAWHLDASAGLTTLVSSKVNQWTLLVGTLPVLFAVASGGASGLPIGTGQRSELFLTAAQSVFGLALVSNLRLTGAQASALLALFVGQLVLGAVVPEDLRVEVKVALGAAHLVGALAVLARRRHVLGPLVRDGLRTPHAALQASE